MNNYIIAVDENGQPYIAHSVWGKAKAFGGKVASGFSRGVKSAGTGLGRGVRQTHKYLLKVGEGAKARYAYTKAEADALMGRGRQAAGRAVEKGRSAATKAISSGRDALRTASAKAVSSGRRAVDGIKDRAGVDERERADTAWEKYSANPSDENWVKANKAQDEYRSTPLGRLEYVKERAWEISTGQDGTAKEIAEDVARKAGDKAKEFGSEVKSRAERMREEFRDRASETADRAKDAASEAADKAKETAGKVKEAVDKAGDKAKEAADRAKDAASETASKAGDKVKEAADDLARDLIPGYAERSRWQKDEERASEAQRRLDVMNSEYAKAINTAVDTKDNRDTSAAAAKARDDAVSIIRKFDEDGSLMQAQKDVWDANEATWESGRAYAKTPLGKVEEFMKDPLFNTQLAVEGVAWDIQDKIRDARQKIAERRQEKASAKAEAAMKKDPKVMRAREEYSTYQSEYNAAENRFMEYVTSSRAEKGSDEWKLLEREFDRAKDNLDFAKDELERYEKPYRK